MTDKFNSIPKIVGLATVMAAIGTLLFEFVYVGVVNDLPKEFLSSEEKVALVLISALITASVLAFSWCIYGTVAVIFQIRDKVMRGGDTSAGSPNTSEVAVADTSSTLKKVVGISLILVSAFLFYVLYSDYSGSHSSQPVEQAAPVDGWYKHG